MLRETGVPIVGEAGPGGGVRLEGQRGVTAVHLSVSEIATLWLTARLSQAGSDLPWGGAANSALSKLLASLPRDRAQELRALCRRVIIGTPPSQRVLAGAGQSSPELLRLFEEAFSGRVGLGFEYCDREDKQSSRSVEPHGLLVQGPVWYVLARDLERDGPRMFRMDRISRPRLLRTVQFRPDANVIWALLSPECRWRSLLGEVR